MSAQLVVGTAAADALVCWGNAAAESFWSTLKTGCCNLHVSPRIAVAGEGVYIPNKRQQRTSHLFGKRASPTRSGIYFDGEQEIQYCLRQGLIDEMTIGVAPMLVGEGVPLFGAALNDIWLSHVGTSYGDSRMT